MRETARKTEQDLDDLESDTGLVISGGEFNDEEVEITRHHYIKIDATPLGLKLTSTGARKLAAELLNFADDFDGIGANASDKG